MNIHTFWGNPSNADFGIILDHFSGTEIHSPKTSSVPLAQYWKDTANKVSELFNAFDLKPTKVELHFEWPTKSIGNAKSSMTDLMLVSDVAKLAIEAKYTEYSKSEYKLVQDWRSGVHRPKQALDHWMRLLGDFLNGSPADIDKLPYQFIHRSASACEGNPPLAIVIYQLFYDNRNDKDLERFVRLIEESIEALNPSSHLKYLFMFVPVKRGPHDVPKHEVFMRMKSENIYKFGRTEYVHFPHCD